MKHKTNAPGLIVALGSPANDAGKMGVSDTGNSGPLAHARGSVNALSEAANMDTVPLDMLSMPDDQEQMQPPDVGDVVNYQVTGKVVAIEGDYAKVQRQSINGQELPDADPDETNGDNVNPQNANQDGGIAMDQGNEAAGLRQSAAGIGMLS